MEDLRADLYLVVVPFTSGQEMALVVDGHSGCDASERPARPVPNSYVLCTCTKNFKLRWVSGQVSPSCRPSHQAFLDFGCRSRLGPPAEGRFASPLSPFILPPTGPGPLRREECGPHPGLCFWWSGSGTLDWPKHWLPLVEPIPKLFESASHASSPDRTVRVLGACTVWQEC